MKLKNIGRAALATVMSLGIGFGATACSRDYTVAYVYSVSQGSLSTGGLISAYAVDYQSGALTQIAGSPFSGVGNTPVSLVASPNGKFVYTINNATANVTTFAVGTDGKLYGQTTTSLVGGSYPTAATIDSTGSFLYVTFTLQSGFSPQSPGKGGVDIFPINTNASSATYGQLGTPIVVPAGNNPVSIAVSQPYCYTGTSTVTLNAACNGTGHYVVYAYVLDQEGSVIAPTAQPSILGFSQDMSKGGLTPLAGTNCPTTPSINCTGYLSGVTPSAIVIEPTTRYVYVTDKTSNQILGYGIASNSTGDLTTLKASSPYITGQYPVNLVVDPRGKYILTANYNSNTIGSYVINLADGSLGGVSGSAAATVATGPTCVAIEPALGIYVYTSNSIDNSISAEKLDANTGALTAIANTPFNTSTLPECVVAVANGAHAQSVVNE
jgi:6-phosphogluconolactonase